MILHYLNTLFIFIFKKMEDLGGADVFYLINIKGVHIGRSF